MDINNPAAPLVAAASSADAAPQEARALRILVVEDDAVIQMLLCETLTAMGHEVCAAAATEWEAVAAAERTRPDLLIVDHHLGEGSGRAAVREILRKRAVPHIFVSGDSAEAVVPGRLAVTLQKPYQEHELKRAIAAAMAGTG
jgi:CheY-like chemotaxis protein